MKLVYNNQIIKMRRQNQKHSKRAVSYRKPVVQSNPLNSLKQGFFNISTNLAYSFSGGVNKFKSFIQFSSETKRYILGRRFENEEQAKDYMASLIWFSYRKMPGLAQKINCDTGWGCLIRVGQMALAAGLKRYFKNKNDEKSQITYKVLVAFVQNGGAEQKYSLRKIVERAHSRYKKKYGDWFNVFQICQVLSDLHTKYPMKGAQNLSLVNFEGSMIYIQQMMAKMNEVMCSCEKRRIQCPTCSQKVLKQQSRLKETNTVIISQVVYKPAPVKKELLVFVDCRLGSDEIDHKKYQQLKQLLSFEYSLGIIGGIPKRGLYFVGYEGDQLICLDPHFVQDEVTLANLQRKTKTFSCNQMRRHSRKDIDPSLSFVFYIDSLQAMRALQDKVQGLHQRYEDSILSIKWSVQIGWNNQFQKNRQSIIESICDQDDGYQNSFLGQW